MDTSKEYILQCEKAVVVQELKQTSYKKEICPTCEKKDAISLPFWNWEIGDWILHKIPKGGIRCLCSSECFKQLYYGYRKVWLPRQDQLQEMVEIPKEITKANCRVGWLLGSVSKFVFDSKTNYTNSMEQLWLAFVMKERFGKTWNGNDWEGKS